MVSSRTKNTTSDNIILSGVLTLLDNNNEWVGTMTDLSRMLVKCLGKKVILPGSPSALRVVLNRVVNRLRCRGVSVKFNRAPNYDRTRLVRFKTKQ